MPEPTREFGLKDAPIKKIYKASDARLQEMQKKIDEMDPDPSTVLNDLQRDFAFVNGISWVFKNGSQGNREKAKSQLEKALEKPIRKKNLRDWVLNNAGQQLLASSFKDFSELNIGIAREKKPHVFIDIIDNNVIVIRAIYQVSKVIDPNVSDDSRVIDPPPLITFDTSIILSAEADGSVSPKVEKSFIIIHDKELAEKIKKPDKFDDPFFPKYDRKKLSKPKNFDIYLIDDPKNTPPHPPLTAPMNNLGQSGISAASRTVVSANINFLDAIWNSVGKIKEYSLMTIREGANAVRATIDVYKSSKKTNEDKSGEIIVEKNKITSRTANENVYNAMLNILEAGLGDDARVKPLTIWAPDAESLIELSTLCNERNLKVTSYRIGSESSKEVNIEEIIRDQEMKESKHSSLISPRSPSL